MSDEITASGPLDPEESKAIHFQEMEESLERENYEIINSLDNCPNCGAKLAEQTSGSYSRVVCPVCQTVTLERYEQD